MNDLLDKHFNLLAIFITVLIMACALVLVQCAISVDISWETSTNIAAMVFVYGFPYILAIPAIWDIALRNSAKQFLASNVEVQNLDSIEEVASLDYLAVQAISILDKTTPEAMAAYKKSVRRL